METSDVHERRCLELLAAYYRVNCRTAELGAARAAGKDLKDPLDSVAEALGAVDAIEDRYAPVGFYGDPVMDGVFYCNIQFVRPERPRVSDATPISSHIAVPGLEEIPKEELCGEPVVVRWINGKAHS